MRLLVFGASGAVGRHVVGAALKQGYVVTALLENHKPLGIRHEKLREIHGRVLNSRSVFAAMKGQSAVVCALEPEGRGPTKLFSEGAVNIVDAMAAHGVKRLVCLSTVGVLGSDAGLLHKHVIIPLFKKHEFADKRRQLEIIMRSDLDWIVVRHAALTSGPRMNKYHVSLVRPVGGKISQANVADFIVKQLTQDRFLREMPIVSG